MQKNNVKKITGKRLQEALNEIDISQQELADRSGVGKASISQYINAKTTPSNITAYKMAKVLNVTPEWLMGFDVGKYPKDFTDFTGWNGAEDLEYLRLIHSIPETARQDLMSFLRNITK